MVNDSREMLKKVIIYDIVILLLAFIISLIFYQGYQFVVIIGLIIALVNFILNAVITNYSIMVAGNRVFLLLGTIIRIILTAAIAIMLCKENINNMIAFLIGYSLHYIAVVFYGATRGTKKNKKGSD